MNVVFRTDASLQIGTGHVMRCLTLAEALGEVGVRCHFICRALEGNLVGLIREKGHVTHALPDIPMAASTDGLAHSRWLGTSQAKDAEATIPIVAGIRPDWLVVDHYALDIRWETALAPYCGHIMALDDLADRRHQCHLLLDQTHGRVQEDYLPLTPPGCQLLVGAQYALLRREFAAHRARSLQRRIPPVLREILITMGGVDIDNATGQILEALQACSLPADCRLTVVMGATAPWLESVRAQAQRMAWPTRVLSGVSQMAELMTGSDLAIGAAGATSWERCCLGLPTIMLPLADNQLTVANALERAGAARLLLRHQPLQPQLCRLLEPLSKEPAQLLDLSQSAAGLVDGRGVDTVVRWMTA